MDSARRRSRSFDFRIRSVHNTSRLGSVVVTIAAFRTGTKRHTKRPAASEKAARLAWDVLASHGPIVDMKLIDGYWMCRRPNGDLDDVDAMVIRQHIVRGWAWKNWGPLRA